MNRSLGETSEHLDDEAAHASPTPRTTQRRRTREQLTRRLLASTAGLGVAATLVTFAALPSSGKPSITLPTSQQAEAAFVTGLLANPDTAKAAAPLAATMAPANAVKVTIQNYAFAPAALTIKAGETVTWTNKDAAPHTVTVSSGPQTFSSPELSTGDTFSFTFTKAGTYQYYCAVHPSMVAAVTVTGSGPTSAPTSTAPSSGSSSGSSTPTPSTSSSMSMTMPPPASGSSCAVTSALQTLLTHLNTAHLDESPAQQVSDILNIDSYIGNHLALVQRMFEPLTGGGLTNALSSMLSTFTTHLDTAHLDESPAQQVSDILDVNSYIGNHLALVERMTAPTTALVC